jgi:hypothetical protein
MPTFDPAPPSVFAAFASSVERLADDTGKARSDDLDSLHAVLDSALTRAASALPARDDREASARQLADAALARLRQRG